MRKFTIKLIILVFTFYILHSTFYIPAVSAAESTPSADIKTKLAQLKKEIASKAAKLKQEVNQKLQNKAYIGIVKSNSDTQIAVIDKNGPKTIKINQDTIFENSSGKKQKISIKDIEENQLVAGLGETDELNNLIAKKVVLLADETWQDTYRVKTVLWGQITKIEDEIITIKDRDTKTITISTAKIDTEFKTNDFVIITGYLDKNQLLRATFAYVIPQGGVLKSKKVATPSAKIATASSKPKPTPTPKSVKK